MRYAAFGHKRSVGSCPQIAPKQTFVPRGRVRAVEVALSPLA